MTPQQIVSDVKQLAGDWEYDVVAIGYPGRVVNGRIVSEPRNLGQGWVGFDFAAAFGCRVKVINDAAMQAMGHYKRGLLLFIGLGTGLGSALIADGVVIPTEIGHLSARKGTYEDYVGRRALKRLGRKRWQKHVEFGLARLMKALNPDDVVLGGGNAKKLTSLPPGRRAGTNIKAFIGGFRLWEEKPSRRPAVRKQPSRAA
jgi:polyphosphate glucokinase